MSKTLYDVIIVGSGPSGVHTAYPLLEAGLKVAIIDGGLVGKFDKVSNKTNQILKIQSNIKINQSLAKGGLSEVWPGICDYFTPEELTKTGLPPEEITKEYEEISKIINLNVKPTLDMHSLSILKASNEVYTLPITYPYRTSSIVDDFKKFKNFTHISGEQVIKVAEKKSKVEIQTLSTESSTNTTFTAKELIMAAGSINTTRILLRSFGLYNKKTPFLTKCNYMFICINPKTLLKKRIAEQTKPGQVAISDKDFFVQFYRCNLSALEKALPYIPLPKKIASLIFRILSPYLVIADVRFETKENKKSFLKLKRISYDNDILEIVFSQTKKELELHKLKLKEVQRTLFKLGLFPVKMLKGEVTSHYANGVPIRNIPEILSCDSNGRLHQAKRIYIADSSTWYILPAKPPTLTIMANASRIGKHVLKRFRNYYD